MPKGFTLIDGELGWPASDRRLWTVVHVAFGHKTEWQLCIGLERDGQAARISFAEVVSFRVHDEAEIAGYWTTRAAEQVSVGTFYLLRESAYLGEIAQGVSGGQPLRQYVIAGEDTCVEVITSGSPRLSV